MQKSQGSVNTNDSDKHLHRIDFVSSLPGQPWEEQEAGESGHGHDFVQQTNLQQRVLPMDEVSTREKQLLCNIVFVSLFQ